MPLVNTKKMFEKAIDGGFAIGAFNVNNMEIIQGIMEAVASEKAPVILQISKGAREYANIRYLKALIDTAVAEYPDIPIAVHCDHGDTVDLCKECVSDGYTSVMIDGSHHSFDENVRLTKAVAEFSHAQDPYVSVEAELGQLGGIEEDVVGADDYEENIEKYLTDPEQAAEFWKASKCDSLAVAIGTSHGAFKFKKEPKLAFNRIEQIMKTCPGLPLVMHGSSSVPKEFVDKVNTFAVIDNSKPELIAAFAKAGVNWEQMPKSMGVPEDQISKACQQYAVCKVNIDTDIRLGLTASILEVWANDNIKVFEWLKAGGKGTQPAFNFDPRKYLGPARKAVKEMVARKLHVLGAAGKAGLCS
ncbi:MAG: ketose-bisphosphate aldolase [Phycisphaerae bacterium]|nr:ketose-bisphosphate aldolase [Phycisphaerae bacterium]